MKDIKLSVANKKAMRDGEPFVLTYQGIPYHITPPLYEYAKAAWLAGATSIVVLPEVVGQNRMEQIRVVA